MAHAMEATSLALASRRRISGPGAVLSVLLGMLACAGNAYAGVSMTGAIQSTGTAVAQTASSAAPMVSESPTPSPDNTLAPVRRLVANNTASAGTPSDRPVTAAVENAVAPVARPLATVVKVIVPVKKALGAASGTGEQITSNTAGKVLTPVIDTASQSAPGHLSPESKGTGGLTPTTQGTDDGIGGLIEHFLDRPD